MDTMKNEPNRFAVEELITPDRALQLLVGIKNVRRPRTEHIAMLARAMESGLWEMNGCTIKVNSAGCVIDGEHRLRACIRAGVPFRTLVAYGIEESSTIDTGARARTLSQLIGANGIKNASIVASIARLAVILEEDGNLERLSQASSFGGISVQRTKAFVDEHNGALELAAQKACPVAKATRLPSGALGLVAVRAARNVRLDPFMEGLEKGEGLQRGSPVYALRERALNLGARSRMQFKDSCACVFKGWNAYVRGEPMQVLKWMGLREKIQTPLS